MDSSFSENDSGKKLLGSEKKGEFEIIPQQIEEGFEGIIEEGTPILQIIPFKRESWKAEYLKIKVMDLFYNQQNGIAKTILNHYGKKIRAKRSYK